jgi:serine/threonine-protein kinase
VDISKIGKYEVVDVLGRGGMGVVYRAVDKRIGRKVAIKTLTEALSSSPEMLQRFYQEAEKTGKLSHPNIVTVYDVGDQDGLPYIVMEYVDGEPLDKLLRTNHPLSLITKLKIIEDVCSALAYAHRNNVIHRDVKPANVIVQAGGVPKLLDFGIARLEQREQDVGLTRTGSVIGTVPYMAPERLRNEPFDRRSDIFSTGVMLYQLLTRQLPFAGEEATLIHKLLSEPHPPLATYLQDYPPTLDRIVDQSLAKDPEERYFTAEEMAGEISAVVRELKREQVLTLLPQAERLVASQEYKRAREVLIQLLTIDSQHTGANRLLAEVQQLMARRQREEKVAQLRGQAEQAIRECKFDQGMALLEEGLKLDSRNSELANLLQSARDQKRQREQIEGFLWQADAARRAGDFDAGREFLKRALELDKLSSKVRAAYELIDKEAAQAEKKARAQKLMVSAREEISALHFQAAIEILGQADALDPSQPEIASLIDEAHFGLEQERRRRVVEELQNEAAVATTLEQLQRVVELVNDASQRVPSEAALFKLKLQLDSQIKEHKDAHFVEETVKSCRSLSLNDALALVKRSLQQLPGNERLVVLEATLRDRLKKKTAEEVRAGSLVQAREALNNKQYADAIKILERCQAEGSPSAEIDELLQFARDEAAVQQRRQLVQGYFSHARSLLEDEKYDFAIEFLEPLVGESGDPGLKALLQQARQERAELQQKITAVLQAFRAQVQAGELAEAVRMLESQPEAILQSAPVQAALAEVRPNPDQESGFLQAVGAAYAALANDDLSSGRRTMQQVLTSNNESLFLQQLVRAFESRTTHRDS